MRPLRRAVTDPRMVATPELAVGAGPSSAVRVGLERGSSRGGGPIIGCQASEVRPQKPPFSRHSVQRLRWPSWKGHAAAHNKDHAAPQKVRLVRLVAAGYFRIAAYS